MNTDRPSALRLLLDEYQELPEFMGVPLRSVDTRGGWNSYPIHIAVHRESLEEIALLLDAGADVNAAGEYGERPIQIAIYRNRFDIVELLLNYGARCDLPNKKGSTAWDTARIHEHLDKLKEVIHRSKSSGN